MCLFEAVARLAERLEADQPVLVLLNNVHCADPSSLELVHYLARGIRGKRVLLVVWFFWDMRGHLREGQRWLEAALGLPVTDDARTARPWALNAAGWLALVQHASYRPAIAILEEARAAARAVDDERALVRANAFLGLTLAIGTREHIRAEEILEQSVAGGRAGGDSWASRSRSTGRGTPRLCRVTRNESRSAGKPARPLRRVWATCTG